MICPHCQTSLLRKERPGNVCGKCGRRYALDPKTNPLSLNDLRVRRITLKLTDGGLSLLAALGFVAAEVRGVGRGRPRLTREAFRTGPLAEWKSVYGSLPPGVIDDSHYPSPGTPGTRGDGLVLLCPDRSVAVFLDAAGLTTRYGLTLSAAPVVLPGRGPVLVLHDADAEGLLLAHRVRTAQPGRRVVDIGLPLGAVHGLERAVPVRGRAPEASVVHLLGQSGEFTPAQLKWLGRGWGFPLVGVPPAKLLAVVSRAVEKAGAAADPERRRAASLGFLTWPEEDG